MQQYPSERSPLLMNSEPSPPISDDHTIRVPDSSNLRNRKTHHHTQSKLWKHFAHGISFHIEEKKHTRREKLGEVLEGHVVQFITLMLTVLDLIIVGVELFLLEHYVRCEEEVEEGVETAETVLRIFSLTILGVLGIEVFLLLVAFGAKFFKHPLYVLDLIVIWGSFVIELVFSDAVGGLLVVVRLWRIVRVVHGVTVSIEERNAEHIKKLQEELESTRAELQRVIAEQNKGTAAE